MRLSCCELYSKTILSWSTPTLLKQEQPRPWTFHAGGVVLLRSLVGSTALMGNAAMALARCSRALMWLSAGVWMGLEAAIDRCMPCVFVYAYPRACSLSRRPYPGRRSSSGRRFTFGPQQACMFVRDRWPRRRSSAWSTPRCVRAGASILGVDVYQRHAGQRHVAFVFVVHPIG